MLAWMLAETTASAAPEAAPPAAATTVAAAPATPNDLSAPHRFRSGLAAGLELGAGPVGSTGYPNDVTKIGDPAYRSSSGWMVGVGESVFAMGALTDYMNFGFWYEHGTASNAHWRSVADGVGLRVEAFPLLLVSPALEGIGVRAEFGVGNSHLTSKTPGGPSAEGTQSFIGAGAFYEWSFLRLLGGHFAVGPSLEYASVFSLPLERSSLLASVRLVFYGGPGSKTSF